MSKDYFNTPIELYRGFLDSPPQCLGAVIDYLVGVGDYDNLKQAEDDIGFKYTTTGDRKEYLQRCKYIYGQTQYSGVLFSIPRALYWDYFNNVKTEKQNLLLLAYLSLKSMSGRRDINISNAANLFNRMAGYAGKPREGEKITGRMAYYMASLSRMRTKAAELRLELMDNFNNFHCYTAKGKRGFAFMFCDNAPRDECMERMARYMKERTKTYKHSLLKDMMRQAEANVS